MSIVMFVFVDFFVKVYRENESSFQCSLLGDSVYHLELSRDLNTYTTTRSTYLLFEKCLV